MYQLAWLFKSLSIKIKFMKKIMKINLLALAIAISFTACNNNDGTSTPKGDKVMSTGDSSGSGGSSATGQASGESNNSSPAMPTGSDTSSMHKSGMDSSSKMKP